MKVCDFLCYGSAFGMTSGELQRMTGLSDAQIRKAIHAERLEGVPILSSTETGYFLADSEQEKNTFCRSMKHRAREILKVAAAVSKAKIPGSERGEHA